MFFYFLYRAHVNLDSEQRKIANVSAEVKSYTPLITKYATKYGIPQYLELLKAIMMQESGGRIVDVMQSSECSYNADYPKEPNGITDTEYSIDCGVHYFADALNTARCTSPSDLKKLVWHFRVTILD